jgi:hypothetical protein
MRAVVIEMMFVLVHDGAGVSFVVDQQTVGAPLTNSADEPFGITGDVLTTGRTLRTRHHYALKRLLVCAACGRRMQGGWNHGQAHYRCRFPNE